MPAAALHRAPPGHRDPGRRSARRTASRPGRAAAGAALFVVVLAGLGTLRGSESPPSDPAGAPPPSATATATEPATTRPLTSAALPPAVAASSVPQGDLPGWRRTFVEDFTADAPLGSFLDAYAGRWAGYQGWRDTTAKGVYAEDRVVSVRGGVMDMHLRTEGGQPLVAAPVPLTGDFLTGQLYGKFTVRFRADPVPGYKAAWLLWPDSDDWNQGELNFPEGSLDGTFSAFSHTIGAPTRNAYVLDTGKTFRDWHTTSIEWSPGEVVYLLDGEVVGTTTESPTVPMHWVLQTETELDGPPPPPGASGHVQVDWVTIHERV